MTKEEALDKLIELGKILDTQSVPEADRFYWIPTNINITQELAIEHD